MLKKYNFIGKNITEKENKSETISKNKTEMLIYFDPELLLFSC